MCKQFHRARSEIVCICFKPVWAQPSLFSNTCKQFHRARGETVCSSWETSTWATRPNYDVCQGSSEPQRRFRRSLVHVILWHYLPNTFLPCSWVRRNGLNIDAHLDTTLDNFFWEPFHSLLSRHWSRRWLECMGMPRDSPCHSYLHLETSIHTNNFTARAVNLFVSVFHVAVTICTRGNQGVLPGKEVLESR